ncbi:transposase [Arenibacter sp. F26102]|uniref:transposase n=1 Tax=Arenibacter sp. F26102 TaxID=2926416 RepID=UPI001FF0E6E9|nr:transposase [Arenibacter sp. F26102]MCK0144216.1 transposase [Arenibacter sp. F26102]
MKLEKLQKDHYYHIYNRGINGDLIFKSNENKNYFLKLINKYLSNKVSILAYCLMDNHYHIAIQVIEEEKIVTQSISNLFNAYAKAFNKMHHRTGSLFEKHFRRIKIGDTNYLRNLIIYINTNPESHGITREFKTYKYSSYQTTISIENSTDSVPIAKEEVINLFENQGNFEYLHEQKRSLGHDNLNWDS